MGTKYSQAALPLGVTTPLGADALLLETLHGHEALSQPFHFRLGLLALKTTTVPFDKLLGQSSTVRMDLPDNQKRYFNGMISRVTQGRELRGVEADVTFVEYRIELVPQFWLLAHRSQSRVFQQMTVPDILKKVLTGISTSFQIQGTFQPRDYCVQYRETDFQFASRLMEDEGIYYYFKHSDGSHQMVLSNTPQSHEDIPGTAKVPYEDLNRPSRSNERVAAWEKSQDFRAGKVTLRDHSFEKPDTNYEAIRPVTESVQSGTVTHKLKVGGNDQYELYDFPGGYAARFDGVDPGGGPRPAAVEKISDDKTRTASIRMAQETTAALLIKGKGDCRGFMSGCKFTLDKHPNANGSYVLTHVEHSASVAGTYTSAEQPSLSYSNDFSCIPLALPFAPPRTTPKARVEGPQTAVVVGPAGKEIFTDQYSRVKVQFFWDRVGTKDANSSCWVRVGTPWAGQQWGTIHIPRIGQEVIVAFEEGDPDQPIIVGSVYNATNMPPYKLPDNATQSGIKSRSTLEGSATTFNELRFEDKKDSEDVFFHAQKDFHRVVVHDDDLQVGHDQTIAIKNDRTETVEEGNESVTIKKGNRTVEVTTGNESLNVKTGNRSVEVGTGNDSLNVKTGNRTVEVGTGNESLTVKTGNRAVEVSMGNDSLTIKMGNQTTKVNLGQCSTEAMQSIELKVGQSSIRIDQMGVTIKGMVVKVQGQVQVQVQGTMVQIAGEAMTQISGGIVMIG